MAGDQIGAVSDASIGAGYSTLSPPSKLPAEVVRSELPDMRGTDQVSPPPTPVDEPQRLLTTSLIARPIPPRNPRLLKIGTILTLYAGIPIFASGIPIVVGGAVNDALRFPDSHSSSYTTPIGLTLSGAGMGMLLSGFIMIAVGSRHK